MGANAGYDSSNIARYCREANEATLILPKIESPLGVKNAGDILDVEGIDGAVFGPGDLSAKMGHHGQWEHPDVLDAINTVVDAAIAPRQSRRTSHNAARQSRIQPRTHPRRTHLRSHPRNRIRPLPQRLGKRPSHLPVTAPPLCSA